MSYYTMVVTSAVLANASDVFFLLDPDVGGRDTFSVALSPSGTANATHYACRTPLAADVHNALVNMSVSEFKAFVDAKAAERGRDPVGSVTAFKNNVQISEANASPWAFIESLGLKMVQSDVTKTGGKN